MSDGTSGDWARALRILAKAPAAINAALNQATMREAHTLRGQMVRGIDSQAPAGKKFAAHSAITLAVRRFRGGKGSKILIASTTLRNRITVARIGSAVFVGVLRRSRGKGGKSGADLARIHEEGRKFTRTLTPKARRFLFAALAAAGLRRARVKKPPGSGAMVTIRVTIPARPFIGPIVQAMDLAAVRQRVIAAVSKAIASL